MPPPTAFAEKLAEVAQDQHAQFDLLDEGQCTNNPLICLVKTLKN